MIPIYGLHHDPDFYPEPQEFRPERFLNGGLKRYQQQGVFLGFGNGPRQCVGIRLGLTQTKAALAAIVRRFEVRVHKKTSSGIELDPLIFVGAHKGGIWLNFVKRPAVKWKWYEKGKSERIIWLILVCSTFDLPI